MTTLFISDLHLDAARPQITGLFLDFLRDEAAHADALYVLGDLFEAWVGDDDPDPIGAQVADGFAALAKRGVHVHVMRGNRDFMLGRAFAERAGARLLPDELVIDLYGVPTLILHGDTLCTDDVAYQAFRAKVRDRAWQQQMLALPLEQRLAMAAQLRQTSREHQRSVAEEIMDVAPREVTERFVRYGLPRMIHGHTHRPARHQVDADGRTCERIVLGDWYEQGSVLRVHSANALELSSL